MQAALGARKEKIKGLLRWACLQGQLNRSKKVPVTTDDGMVRHCYGYSLSLTNQSDLENKCKTVNKGFK
eukprot:990460-Pelagomonas_calceolata.AAC.1